jgi:hypothetical protein
LREQSIVLAERIDGRTGLVNLPKPDNCLLFIEQLKVNQYKVYNHRKLKKQKMLQKRKKACAEFEEQIRKTWSRNPGEDRL